jgi:GAF domain-containing protein
MLRETREVPVPASDTSPLGRSAEDPDITERSLLQSIVEVARGVFGAAAASVFLLDQRTDELVFEAVSGAGEDHLIGTRFPSETGLAGWVAMSGQPLMVDDVSQDPQFARDVAESTGYVPRSIIAAPLIRRGECVGVLEVLDSGSQQRSELSDLELVGLLATEGALGLELLVRLRWLAGDAAPPDPAGHDDLAVLRRVAQRLPAAQEPVSSAVRRLLATVDDLLGNGADGAGGHFS